MIYIVALVVGFKCPRKIHLNTQWVGWGGEQKAWAPTLTKPLLCKSEHVNLAEHSTLFYGPNQLLTAPLLANREWHESVKKSGTNA